MSKCKVTRIKSERNKRKEKVNIDIDDANEILFNQFLFKFNIEHCGNGYVAKFDEYQHQEIVEHISASIWHETFEGRVFDTIADIILSYLPILQEQNEYISTWSHVEDSDSPEEGKLCSVLDSNGLIIRDIRSQTFIVRPDNVTIEPYEELKFYYEDGSECHDVIRWSQDDH